VGLALAAVATGGTALAQQSKQTAAQQQAAQAAQAEAAQKAAAASAAQAAAADKAFKDLQAAITKLRDDQRRLNQERETRFRAELQKQEKLAADATQRRAAAETRGNQLDREWNQNEAKIAVEEGLLKQHEGNLGELFGVTRQVAGDAANTLQQSPLSTQFNAPENGEERAEFLRRLAGARALPSITELERLWYELMREMTNSSKVVKYKAPVLQPDKSVTEMEVVRVGPFTTESNGQYLGYLSSMQMFATLNGELQGSFRDIGRRLQNAPPNSGYVPAVVDPASGSLLGLYVERPGPIRRIEDGEVVGYVIIAVGILGVVLALVQAIYLVTTRFAVSAQLRNLRNPKANNPLGRVLLAFRGDNARLQSSELAELRISEAVLREVPRLERFQSFLRLAVAAGPLLGLIGTVIGMIITFRAIVASGSSDPKLMAHGIGQAMIATVLGLAIAIPLLFINAGLVALSRSVTQILDEQSQALLAESSGERKNAAS
jgi:biopolymer transport protein ExbB